jgi:hypothetical protein
MAEALVGAYGPLEPLDTKTKEIFAKATKGLLGVGYTPLLVATQVVAGTNYFYICNARMVVPEAQPFSAEVIIFQPLKGDPHITSIKRLP